MKALGWDAPRVPRGILALLICATCAACGGGESRVALSSTFATPEGLAQAVLDGLQQGDRPRLASLMLSEAEFSDTIWPELPASRSGRNLPIEYAWRQLKQRSDGALATILAQHAGQRYELVRIEFTGETTSYSTFTVRRDSLMTVRDANGAERRLRLFGSAVVQGERWKLFSYVVE